MTTVRLEELDFSLYRDIPLFRTKGDDSEMVVCTGLAQLSPTSIRIGVRVGFYGQRQFLLVFREAVAELPLTGLLWELDEDEQPYGKLWAALHGRDGFGAGAMLRLACTMCVAEVARREGAEVAR